MGEEGEMSLTNEDRQWIDERLKVVEDRMVETMRTIETGVRRRVLAASARIRARAREHTGGFDWNDLKQQRDRGRP
jgi:hypothetical protein